MRDGSEVKALPYVQPHPSHTTPMVISTVGIELRRASCRWRVTVLALSIAGRVHISTMATFPEGRVGPGAFTPSPSQARKSRSSCGNTYRFDSVAKRSQCPDHSRSAGSLSLFTYCGPAFLIANAVVQDYPDQLTEAIRNCADGFVVS